MKKLLITVVTLLLVGASWALDLSSAKDQGLVGEADNGYLAIVKTETMELKALVDDINQKRKAIYSNLAEKEGKSLTVIEKVAAERNIKKTQSGHYIRVDGSWYKK